MLGTPCVFPSLECAPCPPVFLDDVYDIFIEATVNNVDLTQSDIESIRVRCGINKPTTTTTSTTTSTTLSTTTTDILTTELLPLTSVRHKESLATTHTQLTVKSSTPSFTADSTDYYLQNTDVNEDIEAVTHNISGFHTSSDADLYMFTSDLDINSSYSAHNGTSTEANLTSSDVTSSITVDQSRSFALASVCHEVCMIGLITGAVCVLVVILAAIAILFRKSRSKQSQERGRSRNRFDNMPNVDLYDSIDVDDPSSIRGSRTSFFRRSGDNTQTSEVVFDNPAYRRSFELRPSRPSSAYWYDPEAVNFEYSLSNANLVNQKPSNPKGRSLSSSRLYDKRASSRADNSQNSNRTSLQNYLPKACRGSDSDFFEGNSPYTGFNGNETASCSNSMERRMTGSRRSLPRTTMESNDGNRKHEILPRLKRSYRSKSFDPDLRTEPIHKPDVDFSTMVRPQTSGKRYCKNSSRYREDPRKNDKMARSKSEKQSPNGNSGHVDRIHRSYSTGRSYNVSDSPNNTRTNSYKGNCIISSNLQNDAYPPQNGQTMGNGRLSRSPSLEHYKGYPSNHYSAVAYRPNHELLMFQTKL